MGQLETFSIEDSLLNVVSMWGLSIYITEEVDATFEEMLVYFYTAIFYTKKKRKLIKTFITTGDIFSAMHSTWTYFNIKKISFSKIQKPIDSRIWWQDSNLTQIQGANDRQNLEKLEKRYHW